MTLESLITNKKGNLIYVDKSAKVLDAIKRMCDGKVGSLLIQTDDGQLAGILTERDILRFCAIRSGELESTEVGEVMTPNPVTAPPNCSNDEAMTLMTERRFRHLPIVENDKIVGIVSIGDLVKSRLQDVTVEIKYLREFISA